MIVDTLDNRDLYQHIHPRIAQALEHIAQTDFSLLDVGSYELDGKNLFVIVNDYQTQPKELTFFEAHQQYIDVQYVASGEEEFGYLPLTDQTPSKPYFAKHDYASYDYLANKNAASFIPFKAGMFALFFPQDIHMPGVGLTQSNVRKVVIKVKI